MAGAALSLLPPPTITQATVLALRGEDTETGQPRTHTFWHLLRMYEMAGGRRCQTHQLLFQSNLVVVPAPHAVSFTTHPSPAPPRELFPWLRFRFGRCQL